MLTELIKKIQGLPRSTQRTIFILGIVATLLGFIAALTEWTDALRPGFIGASIGNIIKDYINYLLGRKGGTDEGYTNTQSDLDLGNRV